MKLELKAKEYNKLCKKLEKAKKENIDPNDDSLLKLRESFIANQEEIIEINKQIKELKNIV